MVLITEEDESFDAPMVVEEVRIKEIHAPTLALGRETTKEQDLGV